MERFGIDGSGIFIVTIVENSLSDVTEHLKVAERRIPKPWDSHCRFPLKSYRVPFRVCHLISFISSFHLSLLASSVPTFHSFLLFLLLLYSAERWDETVESDRERGGAKKGRRWGGEGAEVRGQRGGGRRRTGLPALEQQPNYTVELPAETMGERSEGGKGRREEIRWGDRNDGRNGIGERDWVIRHLRIPHPLLRYRMHESSR